MQEMIYLDINNILVFIACICFLFIFGRILIIPIKTILKFALNSILGAIIIYIINWVGSLFGFHIGVNIITSILIGILGVPGAILLILVKLLI